MHSYIQILCKKLWALTEWSILILQKSKKQLYSSKPSGNGCGLVVIDVEFSGGTSSD